MKHFRSPRVECDTLVDPGVFGKIRQRTLQLRQGNNPCCVQTDAVILDYQGAIRTGIEPALSEYKSAV